MYSGLGASIARMVQYINIELGGAMSYLADEERKYQPQFLHRVTRACFIY